jgi:hypothetical protein
MSCSSVLCNLLLKTNFAIFRISLTKYGFTASILAYMPEGYCTLKTEQCQNFFSNDLFLLETIGQAFDLLVSVS